MDEMRKAKRLVKAGFIIRLIYGLLWIVAGLILQTDKDGKDIGLPISVVGGLMVIIAIVSLISLKFIKKREGYIFILIVGALGLFSGGILSTILIVPTAIMTLANFFHIDFDPLAEDYIKTAFGSNLGNKNLSDIANLTVVVLIPSLLCVGFVVARAIFPASFGSNKVKGMVFAVSLLLSYILYGVYLATRFSTINGLKLSSEILPNKLNEIKAICYIGPFALILGFYVINNISALLALYVNMIAYKISNKKTRIIVKTILIIVLLFLMYLGITFMTELMFTLIKGLFNLLNNIVAFISSLLPIIIVFAVASQFVPNRIVKVKFDDGSYFEIEDFDDGRSQSSKATLHNSDGTYNPNNTHYLNQEEKEEVRKHFKK